MVWEPLCRGLAEDGPELAGPAEQEGRRLLGCTSTAGCCGQVGGRFWPVLGQGRVQNGEMACLSPCTPYTSSATVTTSPVLARTLGLEQAARGKGPGMEVETWEPQWLQG